MSTISLTLIRISSLGSSSELSLSSVQAQWLCSMQVLHFLLQLKEWVLCFAYAGCCLRRCDIQGILAFAGLAVPETLKYRKQMLTWPRCCGTTILLPQSGIVRNKRQLPFM